MKAELSSSPEMLSQRDASILLIAFYRINLLHCHSSFGAAWMRFAAWKVDFS
jgi:hypothetical protein